MKKVKMLVVRESKGQCAMSKPCKHCIQQFEKFGLRKVYYSVNDESETIYCENVSTLQNNYVSSGYSKGLNMK